MSSTDFQRLVLGSRTQKFIQRIGNKALPLLSNQILGLTTQTLDHSDNQFPSEEELGSCVEKELKAGGVAG